MGQDVLSDGMISLCFDTSLNFVDGGCSILIEGQYIPSNVLATPVIPDQRIEVPSPRYIDQMFTAGSPLAESLKLIFTAIGSNAKVYAIPRLDAAGAVKAVYETVITGPATSDGAIDLFLGDKHYSVENVVVTEGDTVAIIATAIAAAVPASFPYTVEVVATGLKWVAKNAGTIGNYLNPIYNFYGRMNRAPAGVTLATSRTTAGSGNPVALDYEDILGTCCYDTYAVLTEDRVWQAGLRKWIASQWSCDKPQCFGHGYTYNSGTLGQVLASATNSAELCRMAWPLNDANFPWAVVAVQTALSAYRPCANPELSIQGREHGVLNPIYRPATCAMPWSNPEMVALQGAGFVTIAPLTQASGGLTHPYVINDVTNYLYDDLGRANLTYRDTSSRRLAKVTAIAIATKFAELSSKTLFTKNTRIGKGVYGTNLRLITGEMHEWAQSKVGYLFSDFDNLQKQFVIQSDMDVAPPCQGKPGDLIAKLQYRPPSRIAKVTATLQQKVLDNCNRTAA